MQCGDLNLDGQVNAADAALLRAQLAAAGSLTLQQSLSCDVISELRAPGLGPDPADLDGVCSLADADVMTRNGQSLPPGPTQACALGATTPCCQVHGGVGCNTPSVVSCVCAQRAQCCTVGWDAACTQLACAGSCGGVCPAGLSYCPTDCFNLANDPTNCGGCGHHCTNAHGSSACTSGTCNPSCTFGWQSCDGDLSNGCESNRTAGNACVAASSLGSLAGDAAGSVTRTGYADTWLSVQLAETNSTPFPHDLSARIELDSPASVNFDLDVVCLSCAGSPFTSSQPAGVPDLLYVHQTDSIVGNDSLELVIHVRYFSTSSLTACGLWTLTLTGDTGVPQGTSAITCSP